MSSETQLRHSFIKIHAPKPIRSKVFNTSNSIKNYSKTPMALVSKDNPLLKDEDEFTLSKKLPAELDEISLEEIEQDFSLFKIRNELSSSNDEILKILSTPKTLSQSLRSFDHNNNDDNSNDYCIERVKNPIYKSIEEKESK